MIGSKLDQGIAALFSLLTSSSGEGDLSLLMAQALGGDTLMDLGVSVT